MTSWSIERGAGCVLFADDFDAPDDMRDPPPDAVEPAFGALDMDDARASGFRAGHAAALAEQAAAAELASGAALSALSASLWDARARTEQMADAAADALARLVLSAAAAMLPMMCRDHGEAEARAVMRAVLPGLSREPRVTVRANPDTLAALRDETAGMDGELTAMLRFTAQDAMPPGDVRVTWNEGAACREAAAIWREIAGVLAPAGLLAQANRRETQDA